MKRMLVLALILAASAIMAAPNFSGSWALDKSKSDLPEPGGQGRGPGGPGRFVAENMTVTQEGEALTIERAMPGRDGQVRQLITKVTLDGKAVKETGERGATETKAQWQNDALLIDTLRKFESERGSFETKRTETWTLSADGKVLTITFSQSTPRGEMKGKAVYTKK